MKKLIKNFFTYPLGHVLALIDFAFIGYLDCYFADDHQAARKLVFYLNWPAFLADRFLMDEFLVGILTPLFIYSQWLVIGSIARNAAALFDRSEIKLL